MPIRTLFPLLALPVFAAPPIPKANPAQVTVSLRWLRQDTTPNTTPTDGNAPPAPVTISAPMLTTVDGQTATMELKGTDTSFFVSLSPTVELADTIKRGNKAAVRAFWSIRYGATKGLPGGVTSLALTGVTRLLLGDGTDAVIARVSLADPKTGVRTEYRLEGHAALGSATPGGTPTPAAP